MQLAEDDEAIYVNNKQKKKFNKLKSPTDKLYGQNNARGQDKQFKQFISPNSEPVNMQIASSGPGFDAKESQPTRSKSNERKRKSKNQSFSGT